MEDIQIVMLYFDRSESAISESDRKYGKILRSLSFSYLSSREDAEECVNDTYAGIWNAIPPARPDNLTAFVCRVARNLALKRLASLSRQKRDRAMTVSLSELEEILPDECIANGRDEGEIAALISDFLRTEKVDARNVFIRKYYFFDSVETIARQYGFSQSKVKSMLYHTRNRLKEYLKGENITI